MNNFFSYLWKVLKQWYIYLTFLPEIINKIISYIPKINYKIEIPEEYKSCYLILALIYAVYRIWVNEKKEKEKLITQENNLSEQEKEILNSTSSNVFQIYFLHVDQIPSGWIRIGNREFLFEDNIEKTKSYVEAVHKLIEKKLVEPLSEVFFELTQAGFKKARELKNEKKRNI